MKIAILVVLFVVMVAGNSARRDCPTIKKKAQWGGLPATRVEYQTIPVQYVVVHHTVTQKCENFQECSDALKNIQNYHMSSGHDDIGYNLSQCREPATRFDYNPVCRAVIMKAAIVLALFAVIFTVGSAKKGVCPTIKSKAQWGGTPASTIDYQTIPVQYVVIHHTVSQKCENFQECCDILKNIQNYHTSIGYGDIGYNFLVGNDGNVYEGCGWHKIGAHTYGYNRNGTGIAFIGDFSNSLPTRKALNAAKKLLSCGVALGELGPRYKLLAARQVQSTVSPGLQIYGEIQEWDNWSESP